jgi:hypothetical protein
MRQSVPWAVAAAALFSIAAAPADEGYEAAGTVRAADYLPAELLQGADWTVAAVATNDGWDNSYSVESRFGTWPARGERQVATRIIEIAALARLEEVSRTDVFLEAVENAVTAPIRLVQAVAEKPKETLTGLPRGIGRWFKRTSFRVRETYHDVSEKIEERRAEKRAEKAAAGEPGAEEAAAAAEEERRRELEDRVEVEAREKTLDYLLISGAERRWYRELGVDPSTDNELLRDAVTSVARVEGLTGFGMKLTGIPSIPFSSEMRQSLNLVWSTHPGDLRVRNRKRLRAAGLSKETARGFEDSKLTLTEQTLFLDSLDSLEGVAGRERLIALAPDLETREEARTLSTTLVLLARLHRGGSELAEILPGSMPPVARTRADELAAVTPAGAVFYTETVAEDLRGFAALHGDPPAPRRRLYVNGITSDRFDAEAKGLGWETIDRWQPEPH